MIAGLKPYPAMKDSGVPWLGDVPEHWERRRLKSILRPIDRRSSTGTETLLSLRRDHGVVVYSDHFSRPAQGATTVGYKIVVKGQLVLNRLQANNGLVFDSPLDGLVSPDYSVFELREQVVMPFLSMLLRTSTYRDHFRRESTGLGTGSAGFLRLYDDRFLETPVPLPTMGEQTTILRFLDHVDRRIRRYIGAKQKLIRLLEEQKKAIIHRAVTRGLPAETAVKAGLDPNVRLKPSGVEWLGDVPEHWIVAALRHRYTQVLGKMLDTKRITGENSLPYLRNTDVQWDQVNTKDLPAMDIPPHEHARYTLQTGDLLVCEGGEVGRAAIWTGQMPVCGFQKALHRLRPRRADLDMPRFLCFALRAAANAGAFSDGHVSTIAHLTGDKLRGHAFPFPPAAEQSSIVRWLDTALARIEAAVGAARRETLLLREFRTRLIADVVTGKLDVREAAARLPEEAEEPEPLDEMAAEAEVDGGADDADEVREEAEA